MNYSSREPWIKVDSTEYMGRGLVACEPIKRGTRLFVAEVIKVPTHEIIGTLVEKYVFGYDQKFSAIALGLGSLFNHSATPNVEARYKYVDKRWLLEFHTTKNIKANDQLFLNYGRHYEWK
jgi:SET domain-containing protein